MYAAPFIDTAEKALCRSASEINELGGARRARRAIVFATLVNREVLARSCGCTARASVMDMFGTFIEPLEDEFGRSRATTGWAASPTWPRARSTTTASRPSTSRWRTTTANRPRTWTAADVILVGVSRCGKTPTSLYLAMQHGIKAANYPLIPEDFERRKLPAPLAAAQAQVLRPDHRPRTPQPPSATSAARAASTPTC